MIAVGYTKSEILVYSSLMAITSVRLMPSAIRIATALQRLKYSQSMNRTLIKELELKVENEKYSNKNLNKKLITFKKNIIFSNVNFSYENQKTVIKDLNLNIKKNYCIGIIGPSGSGKSTFIDLLIGLLKPTSGSIKFDDVTLNQKTHYWTDKISYVSQSPLFLNDTIENNIAFGIDEKDINKKLIVEVSKKAQIFNDIKKLKLNFKTKISEISKNFSGGQLQRIAIARALYRNSELIIFDEATNALDKFTEEAILKTLKGLKKKITMIIISHNKNNLKICDKVYELKNKRLVNKY
jgi:ABC-type bacteriocin/lantibiotic exporter with double-glycine peptidase domain